MSKILFHNQATTPDTPAAGKQIVYTKTDKRVYTKDDTGIETSLMGINSTSNQEIDKGYSGAVDTIDWTLSQKQKSTLIANTVFTFTNPEGPCHLLLKVIQDAVGSREPSWPANVYWPGGSSPNFTDLANAVDIVFFYFDGTDYWAFAFLNFS